MITEKAETKWCPMVRVDEIFFDRDGGEQHITVNRSTNFPDIMSGGHKLPIDFCCVADRCMMWRWNKDTVELSSGLPDGYCGIAGESK